MMFCKTDASCWLPLPIPFKIIAAIIIGIFCAPMAMAVPISEMAHPHMTNLLRPKISERPPDIGKETETAIV